MYGTTLHTGLMCASYICFYTCHSPLSLPWRHFCRPSYQTLLWQPCILCRPRSYDVQQSDIQTASTLSTFKNWLKTHLFFAVVFSYRLYLIQAEHVVRCPYSDFLNMLQSLRNCHVTIIIIIIIIIINWYQLSVQ